MARRYTADEAAAVLDRHPWLVREWLRTGRLRGERFGHSWLVTEAALQRFREHEPARRKRRRGLRA